MLVGKKVILRTLRNADLDVLYDLAADVRDLGDYYPLSLPSEIRWRNQFGESGWWEEERGGLLITNHAGIIVGQIGFFQTARYLSTYEIAYRLYGRAHWGQGYMSEAAQLMVAYLFDVKPVNRLQATIFPDNTASRKVLEKCGFKTEGLMRQVVFHQGALRDLELLAVLRSDHTPLKELLAA
ncbi:MAG: GNAT family N-acetyltransferase [Ardenticatenaceae bacterium]|nr:GNAT family N-acetyltransferase [Ardenticatenaceae bacterium]